MIILVFGDSEVVHTIDNIIDGDLNWYVFILKIPLISHYPYDFRDNCH